MGAQIIGPSEARAAGLKRYFTGKACKRGHVAERYVSGKKCIECKTEENLSPGAREYNARYRAENSEAKREYDSLRYAKNVDAVREYGAAYRAENAEAIKEYMSTYHARNRDAHRERYANYYTENRESSREVMAAWQKNNPDKVAAIRHARRARQKNAEGRFTAADIRRIHDEQDGRCACCGQELNGKYHRDHIHPIALGGSNWPSNIQLLCSRCNHTKNDRDPVEFSRNWFNRTGQWPMFAIARGWHIEQVAA